MHFTSSRRAGHFDWLKSYHSLMLLPMVTALLLMPFMDGTEVRYWLVFWVLVVVVLTICRAWMMHSNRLHLQQHSGVLQAIFDGLPDGIFFKDRDGVYRYANERAMGAIGTDLLGKTDIELFDGDPAWECQCADDEVSDQGCRYRREQWVTSSRGERVLMEISKSPLFDAQGHCLGVLGVSRDVTELHKIQNNLEFVAHHDALTGLPNHTLLSKKADYALRLARRQGGSLALLLFDLDRLKGINDTFGYNIGNLLLQDVARRFSSNLRDSDLCARMGGDEFLLVLPEFGGHDNLVAKATQLLAVIAEPYELNGHTLSLSSHVGISCFPQDGDEFDTLVRHADAALHQAKSQGHKALCFYEAFMLETLNERSVLDHDLREAVDLGQLEMMYQPQFRFGDKQPRRVEALMRWRHPRLGSVSPLEFIPMAETTGQIHDMGQWAVEQACRQFLDWREQGLWLEKIAINVSAIQINSGFADRLMASMNAMSFNPAWLELEITETAIMSSITEVSRQITLLCNQGVEFSIDDFGTGYSSLSKLKSMPVTVLKIDQSFVRNINDDINDYEIVRAIILMAKSLGLHVVAEGIESQPQAAILQRLGCDWVQGFLFSQPLSGDDFLARYRDNTGASVTPAAAENDSMTTENDC
jgi:diguanylate cyclase (GGDEF)-like protein/PAS domain S-box-containing protein